MGSIIYLLEGSLGQQATRSDTKERMKQEDVRILIIGRSGTPPKLMQERCMLLCVACRLHACLLACSLVLAACSLFGSELPLGVFV